MGFNVSDKTLVSRLHRHLNQAKSDQADSLSKLSSGTVFTEQDPRPAERAISEKMEFRIRSLSSAKRNINDAVSVLQTAESSMSEINNMITRMKEINIAAASTTVSDQERRFLFIEYEALRDEMNRIAITTEHNGIPLLNGDSDRVPEQLIFRVDDPFVYDDETDLDEDINTIRFEGIKSVVATPEALGIVSARDLLEDTTDEEGLELEDIEEMLEPEDDEYFSTIYDQAIATLSTNRAVYGAMQTRLERALSYVDVYQENIAAAKSKITDVDYAEEVARMVRAKISVSANTSLLAQSNIDARNTLQLLNNAI